MNLFIPLTKDRFRLLKEDPRLTFRDYNTNSTTVVPVGSIISFEKVKVNKLTRPDNTINILIRVVMDDPQHTMKKYGGKASYGHYAYLPIVDLREIELEPVIGMP